MTQTRREFLRFATGLSGLALTGWATLGRDENAAIRNAALRFLRRRQSPDGAWRSDRYAAFRDGDALTPLVLWAMEPSDDCFECGLYWLEELTERLAAVEPWTALRYPLFTASYATQVFAKVGDTSRAATWLSIVEQLRTSPALGWSASDPACGAWSDSPEPPRRPAGLSTLPDMIAPNLSATVLGVQAVTSLDRSAATAQPFIESCQNFSVERRDAFDDGGFFFTPDDPIRNKAGVAGRENGRVRFHSYGSATCDGLLALIAAGASNDAPRVRAALRWLGERSAGFGHSGTWASDRAGARESLAFYHAQALAQVLHYAASFPENDAWARERTRSLRAHLSARQQPDGSWSGQAPDSCEDDPLVATAFALRAFANGPSRVV